MIVTQLNEPYTPWLDLFLSSLHATNPEIPAFVELVNVHERLASYFRDRYPWARLEAVALDSPSPNQMAHRKVDAALSALSRYPGESWYLLCDVDLLFRASLDSMVSGLLMHDAAVIFRDGFWEGTYYEHLRVASGLVGFRNAELLNVWKHEMAQPQCRGVDCSSWFYDQITLWEATHKVSLSFMQIDPQLYINREFDEKAIIWSAHLPPKELMYLRFLEERGRVVDRCTRPSVSKVDSNRHFANLAAAEYEQLGELHPPERQVFRQLSAFLETARVLDVGVGGGRTTLHLLGRTRSYQAIDWAPAMIDACHRRFPDCDSGAFTIADARKLDFLPNETFDFILFSYNGIDYVDHDGRLLILQEFRRILSPGGILFFSTHSLHFFPFPDPEAQRRNSHVDVDAVKRRGWALLVDYRPEILAHYIDPRLQMRELIDAGFEVLDVLDMKGARFDLDNPSDDWMVYFICQRTGQ